MDFKKKIYSFQLSQLTPWERSVLEVEQETCTQMTSTWGAKRVLGVPREAFPEEMLLEWTGQRARSFQAEDLGEQMNTGKKRQVSNPSLSSFCCWSV